MMRQKVKIVCEYEDNSVSEAVVSSIQPDNLDSPEGVDIETEQDEKKMVTEIEVEGEIETLLNTSEDLLSCASTAEKMI